MKFFGKPNRDDEDAAKNAGRRYLNTVYSLARSASAWRFVSAVMFLLVLVMVYQSLKTTSRMPVRLVPYDYAISKHISTVDKEQADARYLSLIAAADISLISNWTPNTIQMQYRRFLARCAPELFSQQQVELMRQADDKANGINAQAFFQRDIAIENKHVVKVSGQLRRWGGRELLESERVTYRVNYRFLNGVPYIHSFTREVDQ